MNAILKSSINKAEASLSDAEQTRLAQLVDEAVESWREDAPFSAEELAHLKKVAEEPFVEADPQKVAALFAKMRG